MRNLARISNVDGNPSIPTASASVRKSSRLLNWTMGIGMGFQALFNPLTESRARAAPPPQSTGQPPQITTVENELGRCKIQEDYTGFQLNPGSSNPLFDVHLVSRGSPYNSPEISCVPLTEVPIQIRLEFYPFVEKKDGKANKKSKGENRNGKEQRNYVLEVSIQGVTTRYSGMTIQSSAELVYPARLKLEPLDSRIAIGTRFDVDGDEKTDPLISVRRDAPFSVLSPGLFKISIEQVPGSIPVAVVPVPAPPLAVPPVVAGKKTPPASPIRYTHPLILLPKADSRFFGSAQALWLNREKEGFQRIRAQGLDLALRLGSLPFFAGVAFAHQTVGMEPDDAAVPSAPFARTLTGMANLAYARSSGRLELAMRVLGGLRYTSSQRLLEDSASVVEADNHNPSVPAVGGEFAFGVGQSFALRAQVTNDPVLPATAQLLAEFWRIRFETNAFFARLLDLNVRGDTITNEANVNALIARAALRVAFYKNNGWLAGPVFAAEGETIGGRSRLHPMGGLALQIPVAGQTISLSALAAGAKDIAALLSFGGNTYHAEFWQFPFGADESVRELDLRVVR